MSEIVSSVSSDGSGQASSPITNAVATMTFSTKHDDDISADIAQFLPTELSSVESDNGDDNDNLLDEISENELGLNPHKNGDDYLAEQEEKASETTAPSGQSARAETATVAGSKKQTEFRDRPSSCVFAASLDASLSDDELCISVTESFKKYGQLARVKVLRDHANRPYAFVQYTNDNDAKRALKNAQGSVLNGRTLRCESARVNRTLFITHSSAIPYRDVIEVTEKFGELEKVVLNRDLNLGFAKKNSCPTDFGFSWFIQFAFRDDAIRAFANLRSLPDWDVEWVQNIEVPKYLNLLWKRVSNNRTSRTNPNRPDNLAYRFGENIVSAQNRRDRLEEDEEDNDDENHDTDGHLGNDPFHDGEFSDSDHEEDKFSANSSKHFKNPFDKKSINIDKKSIFVGQLDSSVTKQNLFDRFSLHGKILDINLISKTASVFAFIQFETESAAASALEKENHAILLNKTMHVQYRVIGGNYSKRFSKKNYDQRKYSSRSNSYPGPQVNLAPPPINMFRRRSLESETMLPYMPTHFPPEFDLTPYMAYFNQSARQQSIPNGGRSSGRTNSLRSDSDGACGDGNTDATSEVSQSAGIAINTSAGSFNHGGMVNSISYNLKDPDNFDDARSSHDADNNGKKKFFKRHNYRESHGPFYFQPYYYHPMHYPMGPMGHGSPGQAPNNAHPYLMMYPMPPPPPSGVEGPILPSIPVIPNTRGPERSHNTALKSHFKPSEASEFVPDSKKFHLDY